MNISSTNLYLPLESFNVGEIPDIAEIGGISRYLNLSADLLDALPGMVILVNWLDGVIHYANQCTQVFFGWGVAPETWDFLAIDGMLHKDDRKAFYRCFNQFTGLDEAQVRFRNGYGEWRWFGCRTAQFKWPTDSTGTFVVLCLTDITERKRFEEKLQYMSYHDPLTGLYNQSYLDAEICRLEGGRNYPVSTIMIDVDGLKAINYHMGHFNGDNLLRRLAEILRLVFRREDVVARIGGDDFAVLLPKTDPETTKQIIQRIYREIERHNKDYDSHLRVLIGYATGEKNSSIKDLLREADSRKCRRKIKQTT